MRSLLATGALGVALLGIGTAHASGPASTVPVTQQESASAEVTVMSRNLYFGADVASGMARLPDTSSVVQYLWDASKATAFDKRVDRLVAELTRYGPMAVGVQEATVWTCRNGFFGKRVEVSDTLTELEEATAASGLGYRVAEVGGNLAYNPNVEVPPIAPLTTVKDPQEFQPLFGSDTAACGFQLADAVLVREDLADSVTAVGNTEFVDVEALVPLVLNAEHGFAWADLDVGETVRLVSTQLSGDTPDDRVPVRVSQAQQLADDLAGGPRTIIMGDLASDPYQPRSLPGEQAPLVDPEVCPVQPEPPTAKTADATCNAYWTLVRAGFANAGPSTSNPKALTWGSDATLAGPDVDRVRQALALGNKWGFTQRYDYVLHSDGLDPASARVIGNVWPKSFANWACDSPSQVQNTNTLLEILGDYGFERDVVNEGICLPSNHAGLVATLALSEQADVGTAIPETHERGWLSPLWAIGLTLLALLLVAVVWILWSLISWLVHRMDSGEAEPEPESGSAQAEEPGDGNASEESAHREL